MKKLLLMAVCAMMAAASSAWSLELKLGHFYDSTHPYQIGCEWAAEEIAKATEGRVKVTVYPSAVLGSESELMEHVLMGGDVDIVNVGAGQLANAWAPISICVMPYTFRDNAHFLEFSKSPIFQKMREAFHRDTGVHIMGSMVMGPKHIIGNRAIRSPEDFKGFRLRVAEQKVLIEFTKYFGGTPTPTAFSEAYMAIQQNVVDGTETFLSAVETMKFYEVIQFISMTNHIHANNFFLVKDDSYMAMSEKDRASFNQTSPLPRNIASHRYRKASAPSVCCRHSDPKPQENPSPAPFFRIVLDSFALLHLDLNYLTSCELFLRSSPPLAHRNPVALPEYRFDQIHR